MLETPAQEEDVLEIGDSSTESSYSEVAIDSSPRSDLSGIFDNLSGITKIRSGGSTLYLSDLERLRPGEWLNDRIISTYLELLHRTFRNSYVFSTYTLSLMQGRPLGVVKQWFRGVDLTSFEYVLIPIHRGSHWTLAIVSEYDIEYYDSLGGGSGGAGQAILGLMSALHHERHQSAGKYRIFNMRRYIPLQDNGDDCGVFCCMLARFRIDPQVSGFFYSRSVPTMRRRMLHELLAGSIIYQYR